MFNYLIYFCYFDFVNFDNLELKIMFNGIKNFRLPSWFSWTKYWEQFFRQKKAKNQPRQSNGMKSGMKANFKGKHFSNSDCRYWQSFLFWLIFLLLSTSIIMKIWDNTSLFGWIWTSSNNISYFMCSRSVFLNRRAASH